MNPTKTAEAALAADRAHDDPAIWITRLPDAAVFSRARALEAEGPRGRALWGVPFAVKDNIDVAGLPTTAACPGYSRVAETTAPAVQRMLDAGAVLIGKTNLDQFATGLVGIRNPYRYPVQRVRRRAGRRRLIVRFGRCDCRGDRADRAQHRYRRCPGACRRRPAASSG
jgi:allophanate hydrolase